MPLNWIHTNNTRVIYVTQSICSGSKFRVHDPTVPSVSSFLHDFHNWTGPPNSIFIIFGGRLLYVDCVIRVMVQPRNMTKTNHVWCHVCQS